MTTGLFDYPHKAAFGRVLPKTKLYDHTGAKTKLRRLFVDQVDQVVWRFKLAPETLNLAATERVTEIQILEISLRTQEVDEELLRTIDDAIPFPLIFELTRLGKRRAIAAFKRPNDVNASRWVIGDYLSTDWTPEAEPRVPLPVALNLEGLYEQILTAMMPPSVQSGGTLQQRMTRLQAIRAQAREIERITLRLNREKQFNRRVAINAELRTANQQLERLTRADAPMAATSE
jgi:hypothetical protein